jgi:hypothetical protein
VRKRKKYQIFVLFLEVVTLTFVNVYFQEQSRYWGSVLGGAIVSAQYLKNEMSDLNETWYTHAWW